MSRHITFVNCKFAMSNYAKWLSLGASRDLLAETERPPRARGSRQCLSRAGAERKFKRCISGNTAHGAPGCGARPAGELPGRQVQHAACGISLHVQPQPPQHPRHAQPCALTSVAAVRMSETLLCRLRVRKRLWSTVESLLEHSRWRLEAVNWWRTCKERVLCSTRGSGLSRQRLISVCTGIRAEGRPSGLCTCGLVGDALLAIEAGVTGLCFYNRGF